MGESSPLTSSSPRLRRTFSSWRSSMRYTSTWAHRHAETASSWRVCGQIAGDVLSGGVPWSHVAGRSHVTVTWYGYFGPVA